MPNYRRLIVPAGKFFFTINLFDRRQSLLTEDIDLLRAAYGYVRKNHPFETVAICILPDHLHCIWRMPPEDGDYSLRWRLIKSRFSKSLPQAMDAKPGRPEGEPAYGKDGFGSILSATAMILIAMLTTSTGIR